MIKQKFNLTIFLIILIQSFVSIGAGLAAFFFVTQKTIAPNVFIDQTAIGRLSRTQAVKRLEGALSDIVKNGSITIRYGKDGNYTIKYSDIDAALDSTESINDAFGKNTESFKNLFNGYFLHKTKHLQPVITCNEGKLREKLNELALFIEKAPVNADIKLVDGKVVKRPEQSGLKLNLENAVQKILDGMRKSQNTTLDFKLENHFEIESVAPRFTLDDFQDAEEVISQYSTEIKSLETEDSIKAAVHAINKVLLKPLDPKEGLEAGVFSFNKYLEAENLLSMKSNEGYNQVASTLNAAVLNSGIDLKFITRAPHKSTVDYIQPGLDAVVLGNTYDYRFKNSLDHVIIVFAQVKDHKVIVSLVSKKKSESVNSTIEVELEQKYNPTLVNIENPNMLPGDRKLVSQGREGVKVNVYKVKDAGGGKVEKSLLYNDKYEAVKTVYEIGPGPIEEDISMK